jgi:TonB family protein
VLFVVHENSVAQKKKKPAAKQEQNNLTGTIVDSTSRDSFVDIQDEPRILSDFKTLVLYPEEAKRKGLQGRVVCDVLIGKDGSVEKVEVSRVTDSIFIQPAKNALLKARFTPAKQNGMPVRVWWTIPINFRLTKDSEPEINTNHIDGDWPSDQRPGSVHISTTVASSTSDTYKRTTYSGPQMRYDISRYLVYPDEAKQHDLNGLVILSVLINTDGLVEDVTVKQATHSMFIKPATDAIMQMMFYPPTENDKPIKKWWDVPVEFIVNQKR